MIKAVGRLTHIGVGPEPASKQTTAGVEVPKGLRINDQRLVPPKIGPWFSSSFFGQATGLWADQVHLQALWPGTVSVIFPLNADISKQA